MADRVLSMEYRVSGPEVGSALRADLVAFTLRSQVSAIGCRVQVLGFRYRYGEIHCPAFNRSSLTPASGRADHPWLAAAQAKSFQVTGDGHGSRGVQAPAVRGSAAGIPKPIADGRNADTRMADAQVAVTRHLIINLHSQSSGFRSPLAFAAHRMIIASP